MIGVVVLQIKKQILMQHVVKQMKKDPSKSIGVVALSQRQQTAMNEKDLILRDIQIYMNYLKAKISKINFL